MAVLFGANLIFVCDSYYLMNRKTEVKMSCDEMCSWVKVGCVVVFSCVAWGASPVSSQSGTLRRSLEICAEWPKMAATQWRYHAALFPRYLLTVRPSVIVFSYSFCIVNINTILLIILCVYLFLPDLLTFLRPNIESKSKLNTWTEKMWLCVGALESAGFGGVHLGEAGDGAAAGLHQNPTVCREATLSGQAGLHAGGNSMNYTTCM